MNKIFQALLCLTLLTLFGFQEAKGMEEKDDKKGGVMQILSKMGKALGEFRAESATVLGVTLKRKSESSSVAASSDNPSAIEFGKNAKHTLI